MARALPKAPALDPSDVMDVRELAALLKISVCAAYRLKKYIASGRIPGVGLRFDRADVERFVREHLQQPSEIAHDFRKKSHRVRARESSDYLQGISHEELIRKVGF